MSIFGSERKRYNERQNHSTDASTYARKESEDQSMGFLFIYFKHRLTVLLKWRFFFTIGELSFIDFQVKHRKWIKYPMYIKK